MGWRGSVAKWLVEEKHPPQFLVRKKPATPVVIAVLHVLAICHAEKLYR